MWRKLINSTGFIPDVLKTIALISARFYFNGYISQLGDTIRLTINIITIGIPLYYTYQWFKAFLRYKQKQEDNNQFIRGLTGKYFGSDKQPEYQKPIKEENVTIEQPTSLLTTEQIKQFNEMRSKISISEVQQFPKIRLAGKDMPNLVPEAGLFTAKIKRHGNIENLVVMLSSMGAVAEFEKLCNSYGSLPKDFWAEGYLLPSRTGNIYSILLVTAFRFCGKKLVF